MLKFLWNGIKIDGKLYRARYSPGELIGYPAGTITVYKKDCGWFPKIEGLTVKNDSDIIESYYELDKIIVTPDNPHYSAVKAALDAENRHYSK